MTSKPSTSLDTDHAATSTVTTERNRRRFLAALGAGSAVAIAGCLGGDETTSDPDADTNGTADEPVIDSRFGYTLLADDEETTIDADHTVQLVIGPRDGSPVPEFYFEPTGLFVNPGDTVEFVMATPHHNVNAYHPAFGYEQRVPDDVPAFSSPILAEGDSWFYTFEAEGGYDFTCAPHETYGMAGRIVVGSATGPGATPIGEAPGDEEARSPDGTAGTVLADPALEGEAIVEAEAVVWADLAVESKQLLQGGGHEA
ncbi:plastocyanin/azurin family copper-binding protein [Natrinema zhouii]|uniref:Blue (type 1) copper domain-containing protein n=1 Tax=Natrinema zhouii TaxID=1710539 RepID=A0A7D6CRJ3_9EURY|nr:plastocyanin/azurin family copper-binding protein [Natrinema zhouii]QLK26949.1 plastocyanin/azurin family copper-binding protein [Natrinema zhouii]